MYNDLAKRLRKRAVNLKEKFSRNAELLSELMQAAEAIEVLSKMEKATQWIPVTERSPNEKQAADVLCWIMDEDPKAEGYCVSGYYDTLTESWCMDADWVAPWKITHWMPAPQAPEPPKEEKT